MVLASITQRRKEGNVSLQGQMKRLDKLEALNNLFLSLGDMDAHSMSKHWQLWTGHRTLTLPWKGDLNSLDCRGSPGVFSN